MLARLPIATLAVVAAVASIAHADMATELVKVGKRVISVEQANQALLRTPKETLSRLAPTRSAIVERFLDRFIVAPALLEEEARDRLQKDVAFRGRVRPELDNALQRAVERELEAEQQPTAEQVKAFYEEHIRHYERPEAIRIWRILLKDAAVAQKIISEVQDKADGAARFRTLAREHSLDTATKMRSGDLGFVWPNGHTDVPQVRVEKSLVAAAAQLKDGELAAAPITEGDYLAVFWRRGTRPAMRKTLEEETRNIEAILRRDLARERLGELIGRLREQHLVEGDPTLLESIKYPKPSVTPVHRAAPAQHAALGSPEPDSSSQPQGGDGNAK